MLGARRLLSRLLLAALIGALLLWFDQVISWLARVWMEISTGSVTALIEGAAAAMAVAAPAQH